MATGDIKNNLRKLKNSLKAIKYESQDFDVQSLTEGSPTAYLPIYHHAFLQYSPKVAESILNFELFGKSDARFMDVLYKVLRDVFSYKPPINKEQFFMKGFAERKIIMCTNIIELVRKKNLELNPGPSRTAMKTSVRPRSAAEYKVHKGAGSINKQPSSAKISPRLPEEPTPSSFGTIQIRNELISEPVNPPVRHTAHTYDPRNVTRHVAGRPDEPSKNLLTGRDAHVGYRRGGAELEETFPPHSCDIPTMDDAVGFGYTDYRAVRNLPEAVAMTNVPERTYNGYDSERPSWISSNTVMASAPKSVSVQPNVCEDISIVDVGASVPDIEGMYKEFESLAVDLKSQFNNAISSLQSHATRTDPYVVKMEIRIQQQLDNLNAQMVLMANRLQMVESKVDSLNHPHPTTAQPGGQNPNAQNTHHDVQREHSTQMRRNPVVPHNTHHDVQRELSVPTRRNPVVPHNTHHDAQRELSASAMRYPVVPHNTHLDGHLTTDQGSFLSSAEHKFMSDPRVKQFTGIAADASLSYSPIRKVTNGVDGELFSANEDTFMSASTEENTRRSSTPTGSRRAEASFMTAASRIEQMVQNTNQMLKDQPDLPT